MQQKLTILGQTTGAEREAAEELAKRFLSILAPGDRVTIIAGLKCNGQMHRDVDLLVLGVLGSQPLSLHARSIPEKHRGKPVRVRSFAMLVEVKDHDPANIRIEGNRVEVRYVEGWKDASNQAFQQMHSVRDFLRERGCASPFMTEAIWLRGVRQSDLPALENLVGSDATVRDLLAVFARANVREIYKQVRSASSEVLVTCGGPQGEAALGAVVAALAGESSPLTMDRRRLEAICGHVVGAEDHSEVIGREMLVLRGRGGTGKTVRLLRIGKQRSERLGERVLFLTYNRALVADVTRMASLAGACDLRADGSRSIEVRSSWSFFHGVLVAAGIAPRGTEGGEWPEKELAEALKGLGRRLDSPVERERLRATVPFDLVLVDEAQDWAVADRDLLLRLFDGTKVVVADGVDQFVTDLPACDWIRSPRGYERLVIPLTTSLRMKANVCRFVRTFCAELGLDWDLEPHPGLGGGRVTVVLGDYLRPKHEELMRRHTVAGNQPVDALFLTTGSASARCADLGGQIRRWGGEVWDGTDAAIRASAPSRAEQYRIVRYESSRGLEAWTVGCFDLDIFFERRRRACRVDELDDASAAADRYAARWCAMAFTRAIDCLVVHADPGSRLARLLQNVAAAHPDFVEVVRPQA